MNLNIRLERTLDTKRDQGRVLSRFLTWANEHGYGHLPTPSVLELRWDDGFTKLWVNKMSGLVEHGFVTAYDEHKPLVENEHWAIYPDANPAAHVLLSAIRDVTAHKLEVGA